MTWRDLAAHWPEFVQWVVQRYGPIPDGEITEDHYTRMVNEYTRTKVQA